MSTRVDAWIWGVRLAKTRTAATALCRAGHVRVNGRPAKASAPVAVGDEVRVQTPAGLRIVVVRQRLGKRVGAELAAAAYDDRTPAAPPPEQRLAAGVRDRGSGRPTKQDRRRIERLLGRSGETDR